MPTLSEGSSGEVPGRRCQPTSWTYLTSEGSINRRHPGKIPGMPDDLPVDVLTELGRVVWAAIKLEHYAESLCSLIEPANPGTDKRPVSHKIRDAKRVLASWPSSAVRDNTVAWLERASYAIEQRNAALHAMPLIQLGRPPATEDRLFLGEMPRANRPYNERPLTVESLSALRSVLENAFSGCVDIALAAGAESQLHRSHSQTTVWLTE